jgi:hypothetical protein
LTTSSKIKKATGIPEERAGSQETLGRIIAKLGQRSTGLSRRRIPEREEEGGGGEKLKESLRGCCPTL